MLEPHTCFSNGEPSERDMFVGDRKLKECVAGCRIREDAPIATHRVVGLEFKTKVREVIVQMKLQKPALPLDRVFGPLLKPPRDWSKEHAEVSQACRVIIGEDNCTATGELRCLGQAILDECFA